jgi:hypothetical protein
MGERKFRANNRRKIKNKRRSGNAEMGKKVRGRKKN